MIRHLQAQLQIASYCTLCQSDRPIGCYYTLLPRDHWLPGPTPLFVYHHRNVQSWRPKICFVNLKISVIHSTLIQVNQNSVFWYSTPRTLVFKMLYCIFRSVSNHRCYLFRPSAYIIQLENYYIFSQNLILRTSAGVCWGISIFTSIGQVNDTLHYSQVW